MSQDRVDLRALYEIECNAAGFEHDDAQIELLNELQAVLEAVVARRKHSGSLLSRIKRRLGLLPVRPVSGLYVWGGVGRGKTFLMDLFFTNLPVKNKKRVHFHRFMLDVHHQLHILKSEQDPLVKVAQVVAGTESVLCFDELFVTDITDAMVLAGLFRELLACGVVLIITSNTPIDRLYENGLQRESFMPAIKLLQEHCGSHHMGGNTDYRLRTLMSAATYLCPHDNKVDKQFISLFHQISGESEVSSKGLTILGRLIPVRSSADGICWFEFDALCDGPRSKADYVELSRLFHTLLISNVPILGIDGDDPARRFVELVDELYDRRVNVILSAAASPEELYRGVRLSASFERTESRLREFSSAEYLASPHRP